MAGGVGGVVVLTTKISKCKFWVCVQFVCAKISLRRPSSPYIARETVANIYRQKFSDAYFLSVLPLQSFFNLLNITVLGLRPEPHSTEYSCRLNYYLLLVRFRVFGKPKWMKYRLILPIFYAQFIHDLLQRKKQGTLNNGTFLQIALNIALDILKKYVERIVNFVFNQI